MTTTRLRQLLCVLLVVALATALGACAAKRAALEGVPQAPTPPAAAQAGGEASEADAVTSSAPAGDKQAASGGATTTAPGQRRIITTGSMTVEVADLDQALTALAALVKANDGFLANKSVSQEADWRHAEAVVRVPAARFDAIHDGARGLGTVRAEEQQGEDVTKQWIDLEARLRIRKAYEQDLLQTMRRQGSLNDLLAVQREVWKVREQIEQAEGELRYLRDQVSLATLTLTLNEQGPVGIGKVGPWNLSYHVLHAISGLGRALRGLLIALIYVLLTGAVVWVPVLLLVLWLRRRAARRRAAAAAAYPVPPPPGA